MRLQIHCYPAVIIGGGILVKFFCHFGYTYNIGALIAVIKKYLVPVLHATEVQAGGIVPDTTPAGLLFFYKIIPTIG